MSSREAQRLVRALLAGADLRHDDETVEAAGVVLAQPAFRALVADGVLADDEQAAPRSQNVAQASDAR